ncbi:MAG: hypothetical protein ABEI96_00600 [Haloarculaceae archaeon]
MSTTGRNDGSPPPVSDVAGQLRDAAFVRLAAAPDGDAVAATGILARALDGPFQANVASPGEDRATDADLTVAVGHDDATADLAISGHTSPASATAFEVARELDADPDVALALAGVTAAGAAGGPVTEAAEATGIERHPGVAVPTDDLADGLAHTTLVHAPFSGDVEAVERTLTNLDLPADRDEDANRRLASLVAIETVGPETATARASDAVQRALRPYRGGPFETIGGYADVLTCVARESPGAAIALALGHDGVREAALDAWRTHARRAHRGLRDATTGRYDGLFVVRGDSADLPVVTVAELALAFRSPEPVVLALAEGDAAATVADDRSLDAAMSETASELDGTATVSRRYARATFDGDVAATITTFREAL